MRSISFDVSEVKALRLTQRHPDLRLTI